MAKQDIRGDTPKIAGEQMSDVLLIMDKMELSVRAVSEIDKNGKAETVPADREHQNDFLKIDWSSNIVSSFLSNFWSQAKDPTRFRLFKLNFGKFKELDETLKDLAAGKDTPEAGKFLETHEIKPKETANKQSINNKNENVMANQAQTQQQQADGNGNTGRPYRYNESMINWDQLKNFGVSRDYLQEKGLLEGMLKGYKTNALVPVSMNFGSAVLRTDARLSFQQSAAGPIVLAMHGIRKAPELEKPFFGHIFSEEDRKNLKESGNMGRVVEIKSRSGEYVPSFISIDKLTNEVVALKADSVFIPGEVKGIKLSEYEKNNLKEGKAVYLEGMFSEKGREFNAHIQINADRRGIEFIFENDKLFNRQVIGGVELTAKQVEDLNAGKAIFVEDMKRRDGEVFSSFGKLDEGSGKPSYTRYNPDTPEGAREIYIPKEMGGVELTGEDRQQLREGRPVFIENMVNRKGEEYSSFVKLDMETGKPQYSRTPDGFTERPEFKIPAEVWGVTLSATQRANLQDGKAVLVEGMKGYDGKAFSSYLKVNHNQGKLDYYNENPDLKKDASQRNVVAEKQAKKEEQAEKQGDKPEKKAKKGRSIS
ncbi:copper amine oxidase [Bacteroidia bacterium]|nr:copper amine oxidase [Bacteroidia bacterium]